MALAEAAQLVLENSGWPHSRDWVLAVEWDAFVFLMWPLSRPRPPILQGLSLHVASLSSQMVWTSLRGG